MLEGGPNLFTWNCCRKYDREGGRCKEKWYAQERDNYEVAVDFSMCGFHIPRKSTCDLNMLSGAHATIDESIEFLKQQCPHDCTNLQNSYYANSHNMDCANLHDPNFCYYSILKNRLSLAITKWLMNGFSIIIIRSWMVCSLKSLTFGGHWLNSKPIHMITSDHTNSSLAQCAHAHIDYIILY